MSDLVICISPFLDRGRFVTRGQVWAADDPMVARHPGSFGPLTVNRSAAIDQPTTKSTIKPAPKPALKQAKATA